MKNLSSVVYKGILNILIVSLLFPSSYLQSNDDWINKEYILAGIVVAGCAYGIYYITSGDHSSVMNKARAAIDKSKSITYENGSENNEDESIRLQLAKYKEDLNKKWIFLYQKGLNIGASLSFSGTMSAANIYCFRLYLSGQGFVDNAIVGNETNLDGNFIVENSQLSDVDFRSTEFASFNNCLLGNIRSRNAAIVELQKSIVDGNIVFEKSRPGIVVIDKESIISGSLVNGRLVRSIPIAK